MFTNICVRILNIFIPTVLSVPCLKKKKKSQCIIWAQAFFHMNNIDRKAFIFKSH